MTRRRWLLSVFLVWHLTAVWSAAVPTPGLLGPPPRDVPAASTNWFAVQAASVLNPAARAMYDATAAAWTLVRPAQVLTSTYLNVLGFDEHWTMFSNPLKIDQYVRVRYFVASARGDVSRTATELVFPASPEYEIRAFEGFRGSYQDRAINTMLERFHADELNRPSRVSSSPARESPYLPLANYFAKRYTLLHLADGERIRRVEIWHGVAPNPMPTGERGTPPQRLNLLRDYHSGLIDAVGTADPALLSATEREVDIGWTVELVQTW